MTWLYKGRTLKVGKSWTDDEGYKHPYNWSSSWTEANKVQWGVSFVEDVDTTFDSRFNWAKGVERDLEDTTVTDQDGVEQVQEGLKSQWIKQTRTTSNSLLSETDWYVIRAFETNVAIPSDISTHRVAVRTAANAIETQITNSPTMDAFKALFDNTPTIPAPIHDFPKKKKA